jgi:hypothetical protein
LLGIHRSGGRAAHDHEAGTRAPSPAATTPPARRPRRLALAAAVAGAAATGLLGTTPALAADSCPNAAVRTGASAALPQCRAYELVSPADKAGGIVGFPGAGTWQTGPGGQYAVNAARADGEVVTYWSFAAFANAVTGMSSSYRSRRGAGGWTTTQWSPATRTKHPVISNGMTMVSGLSADFETGFSLTADDFDPLERRGDFVNDIYALRPDGSVTWESRPETLDGPDTSPFGASLMGNSADGGTSVVVTRERLTAAAEQMDDDVDIAYARRDGVSRVLGQRRDGSVVSTCGASLGATVADHTQGSNRTQTAMTADASRTYITAPNVGQASSTSPILSCRDPLQIYLETPGTDPLLVSRSERTVADTTTSADFWGATPDGAHAFFTSMQALTDDAAVEPRSKLYRFDVAADAQGHHVHLVDGVIDRVYAFSSDGRRVFGGRGSVDGHTKMVLIGPDGTADVGTVPDMDQPGVSGQVEARATPDARVLLFVSRAELTGYDAGGTTEVFRYEEGAATPLTCVSCGSPGRTPLGDSRLGGDGGNVTGMPAHPIVRNMTPDGRQIAFDTTDALVPQDTNGTSDVYVWIDGTVHLISSGTSREPSVLFDTSADGRDIFFATTQSLVAQDTDHTGFDIYDARIGGGFAAPVAPPVCTGDACQGPSTARIDAPPMGSLTFAGPGDPSPGDTPPATGGKVSVAKLAPVKGAAGTLKVTLPGKGRVLLHGSGLRRLSKTVTKAGRVSLRVALTKRAARTLTRKGKVAALAIVAYTPQGGDTTEKVARLTFTRATAKRNGGR